MESNKEEQITTVSEENIYKLNGRVPLRKAIPFGLQHVLAMFVSNLAPVLIVCSAAVLRSNGAHLSSAEITQLLQCAMFVAGIGTCLQLYPIGVIGSGLPIIMGVSFTFLGSLLIIATNPDLGYEAMAGAVILLYTRAVCYAHGALCGDLLARPELHAHKPSHLVFSGIYHGHVQILQHTLYGNLISQRQFIRIYRLLKWQLSVMALK